MGPLGFALGLDVALDCCSTEETKIPWCAWYLDDGTLVGPLSALLEYLEKLVPALAAIGLEVNLTKCALWGPGAQTEQDMVDRIPDSIPIDHPIRKIPITPFGPSAGITVLGVPVDAPQGQCQTTKKWAQAVTNATEMLRALRLLADGQIRHCLLRHCLDACKVNHLMRAAPSKAGLPFMEALSSELKIATCDLVGCGLTASAWKQATLPIAQGGLGIRDPLNAYAHARTAALSNFHQRSHHVGMPSEIARALAPDQDDTICALATFLGPHHDPVSKWLDTPSAFLSADANTASQSWWADQVAKVRRARLETLGTARDQIRLTAREGPFSTAWLSLTSSCVGNTTLADQDFRSLC